MRDEMEKAIQRVASSGAYILGGEVEELEAMLADYVGVKHCVSCGNGTDALLLSLLAMGVGAGDAVFVPDFTFFATAEVVARVGATPIFVDVKEDTYNIDAEDLRRKVEGVRKEGVLRPRAVMAVDLFGLLADYDALRRVTDAEKLLLVEDGAQSFGACRSGHRSGSFGDISCTSFFPSKPLGCYGDGGALFTNNDDWAALLRSLRVHGRGGEKYENVHIGLNSRLDALQAAVLKVKMKFFEEELKTVQRVADEYTNAVVGPVVLPSVPVGYRSSWAQFTVQCRERDLLRKQMAEKGIPTAVYYPRTMSMQPAFAALGQPACPTALRLTKCVMSLPIHPYLTEAEIEDIVMTINKCSS